MRHGDDNRCQDSAGGVRRAGSPILGDQLGRMPVDQFHMFNTDLQEELLSALAGLRAALPTDLIAVSLERKAEAGCIRCRFAGYVGREVAPCPCHTGLEEDGFEGLATSPILMSMTLTVRVLSTGASAPVHIAYGWNQEESDPPSNGYLLIATRDTRNATPSFGRWPAGFLRKALVARILDVAAEECGCAVIETDGGGYYRRTDTMEPLFDCCVTGLWGDEEAPGPHWGQDGAESGS